MAKANKKRAPQAQSDEVARKRQELAALLRRILETKSWLSWNSVYTVYWWADESADHPPLCDRDPCREQIESDRFLAHLHEIASGLDEGERLAALNELAARWYRDYGGRGPTLDLVARALRALGPQEQLAEFARAILETLRDNGPQSVDGLSASVGRHRDTTRKELAELAVRGLIERDNERAPFRLTDAGKQALG
jgi:hypothetical protein